MKIFVSIQYAWNTHRIHTSFSNITNFPYNKRLVVFFTIFRYARGVVGLLGVGSRAGRQTDRKTLTPIERHWGQGGYRERRQWRRCVKFIKKLLSTPNYSVINNWASAEFCVPSCPVSSSYIEMIGRHWLHWPAKKIPENKFSILS